MRKSFGFTLIELMVTIAVLAIVISIAIPSFSTVLLNNRVSTTAHAVQSSMQVARSEAVKRKKIVTLCRANSALDECEDGADWNSGWLLVLGSEVLRVWQPSSGLTVTGPEKGIDFLGNGMIRAPGKVSVKGQGRTDGAAVDFTRGGSVKLGRNNDK